MYTTELSWIVISVKDMAWLRCLWAVNRLGIIRSSPSLSLLPVIRRNSDVNGTLLLREGRRLLRGPVM